MSTYRITKADLNEHNEYIGPLDLAELQGNLEIEEFLGTVWVRSVNALGYIYAKAGSGIKAGWGITAGLSITCKTLLKCSIALFCGTCHWRTITPEEMTITCGKLDAPVKYGIVKELGLPDEVKTIDIEGKKFTIEELKNLISKAS